MASGVAGAMIGQLLDGKWEIIRHINTSNFGHVYEGRSMSTGGACAVKLLKTGRISDPAALEDFQVEGDLLQMLAGASNVIDLLDRGTFSITATIEGPNGEPQPYPLEIPYIVLELADLCLADLISRRHELPWSDRLALFREVVKGVHQMHQHYVVNRDVKSDNVLVLGVSAKQTDAKISDLGRSSDTKTPNRVSTGRYEFMRGDPAFSAPELIWGLGDANPSTARLADLYLLGSVLFEFGAGVGLTAMAVTDPHGVSNAVVALSGADRQREYKANMPQICQALDVAYAQFEAELPGTIRQQAMGLLRLLTDTVPEKREPKTMSGRPLAMEWDLQWLLRKIDNMIRILTVDERRRKKVGEKRDRRAKQQKLSKSRTAR